MGDTINAITTDSNTSATMVIITRRNRDVFIIANNERVLEKETKSTIAFTKKNPNKGG
jgi:hypothetical protein